LFLSFSFFIIASALMLVTMLFHLSVEMKTAQIGIRLAVGWTPFQAGKVLLGEGCVLATCGAVLGTVFGIGYAWLMIYGLTTWWLDAVTVPFLTLHINPWSLVIGCVSGLALSAVTIALTLRKIVRIPVNRLLHRTSNDGLPQELFRRSTRFGQLRQITFGLILLCIIVAAAGCFFTNIELPYFFAAGSVLLVLGFIQVMPMADKPFAVRSLYRFAQSNIIRNRRRSLYCIALVASTTFLVLSIGVFRIDVYHIPNEGILYVAETAFPVYEDISTPEGREKLSIQPDDEQKLAQQRFDILPFRMKSGDTSSCLNLYQTGNPRVLGASGKLEVLSPYNADWSKLWHPVTTDSDGVRRVPVILDSATAMYSLHLYGGVGEVYELDDGNGGKIRCEVAGLIDNSVLQGEIVMSAENLVQLFPDVGGYQYFLFCGDDVTGHDKHWQVMYDLLGDYGFQGETATDRLRKLFAVQNTYISAFQGLGGIGLLLGVFGLAVIQSRNVFERRKEIALFQAIGFSKSRIILALLYESLTLLFRGLLAASFASFFAVLPFLLGFASQTVRPEVAALQFIGLVGGMFVIGIISNIAAAMAVLKIPVGRELAAER
jgi:hypothetical protein